MQWEHDQVKQNSLNLKLKIDQIDCNGIKGLVKRNVKFSDWKILNM